MIVNVNDLLILECIYYFEKQQQVLQIINKKILNLRYTSVEDIQILLVSVLTPPSNLFINITTLV